MNLLGDELSILLLFTPNLYIAKAPDRERCLWNDPTFIHEFVSNNQDEPRVEKTWNWNYFFTSD
jgi:hypothetical protein